MRLLVVLCALGALFATVAEAATGPVRATLSTSSAKPFADSPWRYTIVVKGNAGQPLAAKARLQVLLRDAVVSCWKRAALRACSGGKAGTWISFKGKRTGVIRWPDRSAGEKLTFQAIVVTGTRSLRLRAPVTVRLPSGRARR